MLTARRIVLKLQDFLRDSLGRVSPTGFFVTSICKRFKYQVQPTRAGDGTS